MQLAKSLVDLSQAHL